MNHRQQNDEKVLSMNKNSFWIGITIFTLIIGCNSTPTKKTVTLNGSYNQATYTSPENWFVIHFNKNFQATSINDKVADGPAVTVDFYDNDKNHIQLFAEHDSSFDGPFNALKQLIADGRSDKQIKTDHNGINYIYSGTSTKKHPTLNQLFGHAVLELHYDEIYYKLTVETQNHSTTSDIKTMTEDVIDFIISHITYNINNSY